MFRFETVVCFAVIALTLLKAPISLAAENGPRHSPAQETRIWDKRERLCSDTESRKQNEVECAQLDKMLGGGSGSKGETENCRDTQKEFDAAEPAFTAACGALGIASGGHPDAIACSYQKERCLCLNENFRDSALGRHFNCEDIKLTSSDTQSSGIQGLIDLGNAENKIKYCPDQDADDAERYEKQLKEAQDRVNKLKEKMPELLNKNNEAEDKAGEKENAVNDKIAEAQEKLANDLKEIKRKREGDEQQAIAEMNQIREQVARMDGEIAQLESTKTDAAIARDKAIAEIELNCFATASKQTADRQARKMADVQRGMPQGNFQTMLNQVGLSSRAAWNKTARYYKTICMAAEPTQVRRSQASNDYVNAVKKIDTSLNVARKMRDKKESELTQIMNGNGCGMATGVGGETKICRGMRQAYEDANQAQQMAYMKMQKAQQELFNAKKTGGSKKAKLEMEYNDSQRELNDELKRIENLRAYLDLKRKHGGGAATREKAKELHASYGKLTGAAGKIVACCKSTDRGGLPESVCKRSREFIESMGQALPLRSDREAPTATPSPSRPDRVQANPQSTPTSDNRNGNKKSQGAR